MSIPAPELSLLFSSCPHLLRASSFGSKEDGRVEHGHDETNNSVKRIIALSALSISVTPAKAL
jgi:hypothetical protein